MATKEKYKRVLQYVQENKIEESYRRGFDIELLTARLKEELEHPKFAVNTVENLVKKLQTASGGVLTEGIQRILGNNFFPKSTSPTRTATKGDFWSRSYLPMRRFMK